MLLNTVAVVSEPATIAKKASEEYAPNDAGCGSALSSSNCRVFSRSLATKSLRILPNESLDPLL